MDPMGHGFNDDYQLSMMLIAYMGSEGKLGLSFYNTYC
jgi:hypothetical protein